MYNHFVFIWRTAPMPHDDLDHIPPIVPTRDGDHQALYQ